MKILIYGAGVLGSIYGAKLIEFGHDVSILARGQRLEDIKAYGIVLNNRLTKEKTTIEVKTVESLKPDDFYDLVMVIMRKNQVKSILPILANNKKVPTILFLGNNAKGGKEYIEVLNSERIILGFPGAAGYIEDHEIRCYFSKREEITIGELSGDITPRIKKIKSIFEKAKLKVDISENINAWLKTHVAFVIPLVCALYKSNTDVYQLAENKDALKLFIHGFKEALEVLNKLDIPILPKKMKVIGRIPEWILLYLMKKKFKTELAKVAIEGHARVAYDEMSHLGKELKELIDASQISTPSLNKLFSYLK